MEGSMNAIVKDVLNKTLTKEVKLKLFDEMKKDIELAERYLSGEFEYCETCNDYYLAKSFLFENETKESQICTYRGIINSGKMSMLPDILILFIKYVLKDTEKYLVKKKD